MSLLQMIQNYKQNKKNLSESINLIPMINLIFLLLIFFLLTGVIQKKDNPEISIPESSEGVKKTYDINQIVLQINKNGSMTIDDKTVSKNEFKQIKINKEDIVLLNIDKDITIKKTNEFLNILKSMGLEKVHMNVLDYND